MHKKCTHVFSATLLHWQLFVCIFALAQEAYSISFPQTYGQIFDLYMHADQFPKIGHFHEASDAMQANKFLNANVTVGIRWLLVSVFFAALVRQ